MKHYLDQFLIPHRFTKYVPTDEDWAPSFPGNYVRVFCGSLIADPVFNYRVGIWGEDDLGMDRDFETLEEALSIFNRISYVHSFEYLRKLGFNRF